MEALASQDDVRNALIATLRDRLAVASHYLSLDTPEELRERYAVLTFGLDSAAGRGTEELRRLHASAGRLIEALAHPEPTHCYGSSYHCQPDDWGCNCACDACNAARAV